MFVCVVTGLLLSLSGFAQTDVFSDPLVEYTFDVPDARWKLTSKPSATKPNVEYVFGDRIDGHLEVRKLNVAKDALISDVIKDEEQSLQFRRGFIAGSEENFGGKLRGAIFNFEYIDQGKNMSGRFYFLRANETTVYVVRFTGLKDSLRSIRAQTDSIARTFGIKRT